MDAACGKADAAAEGDAVVGCTVMVLVPATMVLVTWRVVVLVVSCELLWMLVKLFAALESCTHDASSTVRVSYTVGPVEVDGALVVEFVVVHSV